MSEHIFFLNFFFKRLNSDLIIPKAKCLITLCCTSHLGVGLTMQQISTRNHIQQVLHQCCFRFMSHLALLLSLITMWPSSLNIYLHFFLKCLIFPLMIPFYMFFFYSFHEMQLSYLQASLHILIFNIFCTKSMVQTSMLSSTHTTNFNSSVHVIN